MEVTRQAMYVSHNTKARSRNHYYSGKAKSVTYFWVCVCVCVCERAGGVGVGTRGAGMFLRACSLNCPACNAPSYCHLRTLWLHHVFRNYLINDTVFGKMLLNIKCVFLFSLLICV